VVPHLLLDERRAEDVLGERLPSLSILGGDSDLIMHAAAGVPPPEQFPDQSLVTPSLPEEHLQDPVAEELLQVSQVQPA
jgi:hypothetical protein